MSNTSVYIHPTSIIDDDVEIGEGTRIWHWSHIMSGSKVGANCNIGENAFIETGVVLGDNVKVKNNVALYTGLVCEDNVFIGPNAVFTNVANPRSFIERKDSFQQTTIKHGATIGANATIICGNDIGEYAFIGAGSVVTRSVPAYTMVVGNPARFFSYVCSCGFRLNESLECAECGRQYHLDETGQICPIGVAGGDVN